jgi:hypothetical protein
MCRCVLVICVLYSEVFLNLTEVFLTLTKVFPCFFLSCKANARIKLKDGARTALYHIILYLCCSDVIICVVRLLFMLFYVLFVCKCVLPPGDKPIAVNKYIVSNISRLVSFTSRALYSLTSVPSWSLPNRLCECSTTGLEFIVLLLLPEIELPISQPIN